MSESSSRDNLTLGEKSQEQRLPDLDPLIVQQQQQAAPSQQQQTAEMSHGHTHSHETTSSTTSSPGAEDPASTASQGRNLLTQLMGDQGKVWLKNLGILLVIIAGPSLLLNLGPALGDLTILLLHFFCISSNNNWLQNFLAAKYEGLSHPSGTSVPNVLTEAPDVMAACLALTNLLLLYLHCFGDVGPALLFKQPNVDFTSTWSMLVAVATLNLLCYLVSISIKCWFTLIDHYTALRSSRRTHFYNLVEVFVSRHYLWVAVTTLWCRYILHSEELSWKTSVISYIFLICYLSWKLTLLPLVVAECLKAIRFFLVGAQLGKSISKDEAERTCPDGCAICHNEELRAPIKLTCGHVFCDSCILRWHTCSENFTCPLCRTDLQTDSNFYTQALTGRTSIVCVLI